MSPIDPSNVDVERMTRETMVSAPDIREALGIMPEETCKAVTASEARAIWQKSARGSAENKAAWIKWNELADELVENELLETRTLKETVKIHDQTPDGSDARKYTLLILNELAKKELGLVDSIKEAEALCHTIPEDSDVEEDAREKWFSLIATRDEAEDFYDQAPNDKWAKRAIRRMAEFFPKEA